jgi:hypothetical protein
MLCHFNVKEISVEQDSESAFLGNIWKHVYCVGFRKYLQGKLWKHVYCVWGSESTFRESSGNTSTVCRVQKVPSGKALEMYL